MALEEDRQNPMDVDSVAGPAATRKGAFCDKGKGTAFR
jgi:hypothetical protein